jgi:hypothetical protein
MAAITIAGINLDCQEGGEAKPIVIGAESRAYAGGLRSSVRSEKATFNFTTMPTAEATWVSLASATASGTQVAVSGAILPSGNFNASVKVEAKAVQGTSPVLWIITGQGEEV